MRTLRPLFMGVVAHVTAICSGMHPPLNLHLHSEDCRSVIEALTRCHSQYPFKKFVGACNELKRELDRCLYKEYLKRRKDNWVESERKKEVVRNNMSVKNILNSHSSSPSPPSIETIGVQLQECMLSIKGRYFADDGRGVAYNDISSSQEFKEYCSLADLLVTVCLEGCSDEDRKAFFINVYNSLTIHGLVSCQQLPSSVLEVKDFWNTTCYNIGGHVFSLDDIEHGVLRCNRPHPGSHGNSTFPSDDPRCGYVLSELDPRIHFALVCGAKSCPAIQVYSSNKLERGLTSAARSFCNQEVQVNNDSKTVILSKIFQWYFRDFATTKEGLLKWILQYLDEPLKGDLNTLLNNDSIDNITVEYGEYNWLINKL